MKFKTHYKRDEEYFSNPGNPIVEEYGYHFNEDGSKELVVVGKSNLQDLINSHKEETDITNIVARFTDGEVDALNQVKGFYADVRDFPTNYPDLLQRINDATDMFMKLPTEIKEQFNNDPNQFWTSYGSNEWIDKLNSVEVYKTVSKDGVDNVEQKGVVENE